MAYTQSQIDSQYQILGACPGGTAGTYIQFPQGFAWCATDADMGVLIGQKGFFNPANPYDPRNNGWAGPYAVDPSTGQPAVDPGPPQMARNPYAQGSSGSPANPQQFASSGALSSTNQPIAVPTLQTGGLLDSAMAWVQQNPLLAAGIGLGVVFLVVKR